MATAATAYYCSANLLPKAFVDQGAAVSLSFGLTTLLFMVTIPGKLRLIGGRPGVASRHLIPLRRGGPQCSKRDLRPGVPLGRTDPPPSAQAKHAQAVSPLGVLFAALTR
jgi:hypothetical protein